MKNFPVFVSPYTLQIYINSRHTHKQLLTVYNPNSFFVTFKVLCTSPNKFTVIEPEGAIAPHSCVDVIVRYIQPSVLHCSTVEKFRVVMFDRNSQQELGSVDIPATFIEGEPHTNQESLLDNFHSLSNKTAAVSPQRPSSSSEEQHINYVCNHPLHRRDAQPVNIVGVAVSICCIAALLLPTQPEPAVKSQWPEWLQIGVSLKIVFAFVLGLVATNVLRP